MGTGIGAGIGARIRVGIRAGIGTRIGAGIGAGMGTGIGAGIRDGMGTGIRAGVGAGIGAGIPGLTLQGRSHGPGEAEVGVDAGAHSRGVVGAATLMGPQRAARLQG